MASRLIDEVVRFTNVAGTEQKIYKVPTGEVAIVHKLAVVNTDDILNARVNVWVSPSGGAVPAPGDVDHFVNDQTVGAKETFLTPASGRVLPSGATIYADVDDGAGGNFQNKVNLTLSATLITQSRAGTGTTA